MTAAGLAERISRGRLSKAAAASIKDAKRLV
jgi:hypothetical protein